MRLRHNSRLSCYRKPFGAVKAGTEVSLSISARDIPEGLEVLCRTWVDGEGERLHPMARTDETVPAENTDAIYSCTITCAKPAIVWYSFIAREPGGRETRLGAAQGATGGEGFSYDYENVPSFQITVFEPREERPSWYERGIVYQIFPDRYRRGEGWREQVETELARPRKGVRRRLIEDWDTPPHYERDETGAVTCWDFYGGTLAGIREDLPRLAEMGVTSIYLNPIFEAETNHRYDTGDYLKIDPMLGTEEDFRELCEAAGELGISIILDGVFNHVGWDSHYFNYYGNYPEVGAWQSEDSPYRDWFKFTGDGGYDSWWGVANLPALNKENPEVQELICGEDGVIRHWLRAGARGWRLDVADELSDDLIEKIRTAQLETKPDGLLLGEVWEDASNKISYGNLRRYLLGSELDSVMNYPFRDTVLGFLTGSIDAFAAAESFERLCENYPRESLKCALNLLGSHDRPRLLTVLGGAPADGSIPSGKTRADLNDMGPDALGLAKSRFWLALLIQMTMIGVPCVYYGDEAGIQGTTDPCNRAAYPWGHEDQDTYAMVRNTANLRRALPFLVDGDIRNFALTADVLAYNRLADDGQAVTVLVNRSLSESQTVRTRALGPLAIDLISGTEYTPDEDGFVTLTLWPLGSALIYFHPEVRLQERMLPGAGVVCHITSVPNGGRPGTLGAPARAFVDRLAAMGMRYWQVLPVNPTDSFRSPYAGPSAFAGNVELIDATEEELRCDFAAFEPDTAFSDFCSRNSCWLDAYCTFAAIKKTQGGASWHEWPEELARYREEFTVDDRFRDEASFQAYCQFRFELAWGTSSPTRTTTASRSSATSPCSSPTIPRTHGAAPSSSPSTRTAR